MKSRNRLPGAVWVVLGGDLVSTVGAGASLPYLFTFLQNLRGVSAALAGAVLTARALLAVIAAVLGGQVIDRIGSRRAAGWGLLTAASGVLLLLVISGFWLALLAVTLLVMASSVYAPALNVLLVEAVATSQRQAAFAWRRTVLSLGAALGAGMAGLAIQTFGVKTGLRGCFWFTAVALALFGWLVLTVTGDIGAAIERPAGPVPSRGGFGRVTADPAMRWICLVVLVMAGAGFAQTDVGLPSLLAQSAISPKYLGFLYAVNLAACVVLQLPLARLARGHRRAACIGVGLGSLALAWLVLLLGSGGYTWRFVVVGILSAAGVSISTPVILVLVNDLAPADIRGRYNSAEMTAYSLGWLLGAATDTMALAIIHSAATWIFAGCAVALGVAVIAVVPLHRSLPPELRAEPAAPRDPTAGSQTYMSTLEASP
jgi:MFS family permease